MDQGILSTIGNTPLIRLDRVLRDVPFNLFAKLEGFNPGGSIKDRPAINIIRCAMRTGAITPQTTIIESSSGNMGIGLAQVCAYLGLRFICVVDQKTTKQNIRLLETYGAEVDEITYSHLRGRDFLEARLDRVRELLSKVKNSFCPNQYKNEANSDAHHRTMSEIAMALQGKVDYLFVATSTCGTIRGCAEYTHENGLATKVYAVDAIGSVIFGSRKGNRLIPGHGAAIRPALYRDDMADQVVHVSDLDCVVGCRRLARTEAVLVGGSSGAVLTAVDQSKHEISAGANCVMIFPDRGERYLDTIYSDEWVAEHFGDIAHLWETPEELLVGAA